VTGTSGYGQLPLGQGGTGIGTPATASTSSKSGVDSYIPSAADIQQMLSYLPTITPPSVSISPIFPSLSVSAPGYSLSSSNGNFSLNRAPSVALSTIDSNLPGYFNTINQLKSQFQAGASADRKARMAAAQAAEQSGLSNLKESLAQRRVLGSSFANAQQTQAQSEYGNMMSQQAAQSWLDELNANNQILQSEAQGFTAANNRALLDLNAFKTASGLAGTVSGQAMQAGIDQGTTQATLNEQAQQAQLNATAQVLDSLNNLSAQNAAIQAKLDIANSSGAGNFFGTAFDILLKHYLPAS
jgi:hypothetical protein